MTHFPSWRKSLSFRLVAITVLTAVTMSGFLSAVAAVQRLSRERDRLETALQHMALVIDPAAAKACYEMNAALARDLVSGLAANHYVRSVRLLDERGREIASAMTPHATESSWVSSFLHAPEVRRKLLFSKWEFPVGYLDIVGNTDAVVADFLVELRANIPLDLAHVLVLTLMFFLLCHGGIIRPLLSIVLSISRIDPAHPGTTQIRIPRFLRNTELDLLSRAINTVLAQISGYIQRREEMERRLRESEERYALVAKGANDGIWDWDLESGGGYFSRRYKEIIGYEEDEIAHSSDEWRSRIHPDDVDRVMAANGAVMKGETDVFEVEYRFRHKDGSWRWILGRGAGLRNLEGRIVRMAGTHTDITSWKHAEEALRQAESRYRTIFDNSPVGIFRTTVEGHPLEVNPIILRMFGYARREEFFAAIMDRRHDIYGNSDERTRLLGELRLSPAGIREESVFRRKDGTLFPAQVNLSLSPDTDGALRYIDGTVEDITERKAAERALRESEERYRRLFTEMQEGFGVHRIITDEEGNATDYQFVAVNPALARIIGRPPREVVGRTVREILPETPMNWIQICAEVAWGGPPLSKTYEVDGKPAGVFHTRLFSPGPDHFAAIVSDVTLQRRAEERLRESEARYREIFDASADAISIHDADSLALVDVNAAYRVLYRIGPDEAPADAEESPCLPEDFLRRAAAGENVSFEWRGRHRNGEFFWTDNVARQVRLGGENRVMVVARDVTERRRIQEMMIQTEKMMSVGGLAAGMAHEINNPLGIILQMAQNIERRLSPGLAKNVRVAEIHGLDLEKFQEYLRERGIPEYIAAIREAGERAATIVRSMLKFSRKSESNRSMSQLSDIIENVLSLAGNDYDLKKNYDFRKIHIVREFDPDLPPLNCSETEITQVFLNILRNAAQALALKSPPPERPEIVVRALREEAGARVEFEDNGPGMTEDVQRRLFEPFFTTKPPGAGTGLGLSVSYFIVTNNHGGRISVDSEPGRGSRFVIHLPLGIDARRDSA